MTCEWQSLYMVRVATVGQQYTNELVRLKYPSACLYTRLEHICVHAPVRNSCTSLNWHNNQTQRSHVANTVGVNLDQTLYKSWCPWSTSITNYDPRGQQTHKKCKSMKAGNQKMKTNQPKTSPNCNPLVKARPTWIYLADPPQESTLLDQDTLTNGLSLDRGQYSNLK